MTRIKSIFSNCAHPLAALLTSVPTRRRRVFNGIVLVFLLLPILAIGVFSYRESYRDLTANASDRRQALAYLAAATLKQRLDYMKDIGVALATRVRFRQLIAESKWNEAIEILDSVPKDFPIIERLFLTDPSGTLMVDTPELPEVRGKNFAFRDWYRGVTKDWRPFVSDAYQRTAEPRYNVVAIAVPVRSEKEIIGILVLQVRVGSLVEFLKALDIGRSGFIYIVDRRGQLLAHPKFNLDRNLIDFTAVPVVRKVLGGDRGIEIGWNPVEKEERVAAYEPVAGYGWGIVVQQPATEAFAARDASLRRILIAYGLICLFAALLAWVILRMFTERKKAERMLRQTNEQLVAANKELEAFTYSVSHDLRAPLRAVDGFSRILMEKYGADMPPDGKRYQNLIRDNAKQMGQLIDDLLAFSRLSRQPLKRQTVETSTLVREVLQDLRQDALNQAPVTIKDLAACHADPALLKQVYVNLISNAIKYTRKSESAFVEVGCQRDNGSPVYYIRDNGVGFDMKYADKLFGVFQRLHRAEEYEGTGVGLAVVQRIVQRHGGRVWAEAAVNKGATFFFTLGEPVI